MIIFKKDPETRDIVFKNGKIQMVSYDESIVQNCDSVMRQQLGELRFYKKRGIDYINNLFSGNANYQLFESQARRAILNVSGVKNVISLSYSVKSNTLTYVLEIQTVEKRLVVRGDI